MISREFFALKKGLYHKPLIFYFFFVPSSPVCLLCKHLYTSSISFHIMEFEIIESAQHVNCNANRILMMIAYCNKQQNKKLPKAETKDNRYQLIVLVFVLFSFSCFVYSIDSSVLNRLSLGKHRFGHLESVFSVFFFSCGTKKATIGK